MPSTPVTVKHARLAVPHDAHVKTLLGTPVSTAVLVTAKSTAAIPFLVTTRPVSGGIGWGIQVASYSYDGIIHNNECYRSDI